MKELATINGKEVSGRTEQKPDPKLVLQRTEKIEKHCSFYSIGKCTRGKNLPCNGPCLNMDFPVITFRFILGKCQANHFSLSMDLSTGNKKEPVRTAREQKCSVCGNFYRVKEVRKIRKMKDIRRFSEHLVHYWKLEPEIVMHLLKIHILYNSTLIPMLRDYGLNSVMINSFIHDEQEMINTFAEKFYKEPFINGICEGFFNEWFPGMSFKKRELSSIEKTVQAIEKQQREFKHF